MNIKGNDEVISFTTGPQDSQELVAIITEHLPSWAELFARKNSEYGSGAAFELGERGQFSDIYRKIIKLKRAMWDEDESVLTTEGVDEILKDLIGHCFLTLEMRRQRLQPSLLPERADVHGLEMKLAQAETDLARIVKGLPEFSQQGVSKSDIENQVGLPMAKDILAKLRRDERRMKDNEAANYAAVDDDEELLDI